MSHSVNASLAGNKVDARKNTTIIASLPPAGTGFDDRKETPSMFPNPRKNMWQMKDNGWTPRQYPTDVYGGGGDPYVRSFLPTYYLRIV